MNYNSVMDMLLAAVIGFTAGWWIAAFIDIVSKWIADKLVPDESV